MDDFNSALRLYGAVVSTVALAVALIAVVVVRRR